MDDLLHRLHLDSWPISVKLLGGFLIVGLVPLFLLLGLVLNSVEEVGTQNVETFLVDSANHEAAEIADALALINETISTFINDDQFFEDFRTVLPDNLSTSVSLFNRVQMADLLQTEIINTDGVHLSSIEIFNSEGQLVLEALPGRLLSTTSGIDRADTAAFMQGVQASLAERDSVIAVDVGEDGEPLLDIVHVIDLPNVDTGEISTRGYLVARVDSAQALFQNLSLQSDFMNATSQLVTERGFVLDGSGARFQANLLFGNNSLQDAFAGASFSENVSIGEVQYVRYYVPVPDTPFVLVRQGPVNSVSGAIIGSLISRAFVLILGITALIVVLVLLGNQLLTSPLQRLGQAIQAMAGGNYTEPVPDTRRRDEIGELAGNFADMRTHIYNLITDMETRIEERVRDVTATRDISRTAATQRDVQQLMDQVVGLIIERFENIYHAQIFLLDSERRFAVLQASTGEPGRKLLERGHRLAVGGVSVIGRVTGFGETVVARNTDSSRVHRRNEFLPDTQAELAIPLRIGSQVIGALDVQSRQRDAFTQEQLEVLQTMADQITVAIENARLYTESIRQLEQLEQANRMSTLEMWHRYMNNVRQRKLESVSGAPPSAAYFDQIQQDALARGEVVVGEVTNRQTIPIAVPIRLRGQLLGVVEWDVPEDELDDNKLLLAQDLTDQLAVNLDNARLFQESQRATVRERLVNEISASLTTQNDIDQIMQTAVREIGKALRSPQVSIRLNTRANGNGHANGEGE